ncbi:MAG: RHS repeat-associated core domain-containing protein, partial [Bacteroidales bacterium]|nr:RHS repeat-associated core domain-containing protein [Bacteroidales bacterium]
MLSYTERDLACDHNSNSLSSITGSVSAAYTYDSNGNMAGDGRKNLQMQYNLINLPQTVNQGSVSKARYIWLSDSTKASVVADTLSNNGYTYLGSMVYSRSGSNHTLDSASFGQGRIVHSGSVRVITSPTGTIAEQNDYYPFGERTNLGQQYQQLSTNRYKYNGKEEQTTGSLGYLDYGTRFYDPQIARWLRVDPLADDFPSRTPYNYCHNNPIVLIDPDGRSADWYQSESRALLWKDENKQQITVNGEQF